MKAYKKTLLATALLVTVGFSASANASVIDLFSDPAGGIQYVADYTNGTSPVASQVGDYPTTILGGYRDLIVDALSGAVAPIGGLGGLGSSLQVSGGQLNFINSPSGSGVNGLGIVQWDGGSDAAAPATLNYTGLQTNGVGANLVNQLGCPVTGCNSFEATVLFADQGFTYQIGVYTDDTHWSTLTASTLFPITGGSYTADYLFSWFTDLGEGTFEVIPGFFITVDWASETGKADFANVGAIELRLNTEGTLAVDLTLDSVTKRGLPEPGSLALLALGLGAMWVPFRRRRQS